MAGDHEVYLHYDQRAHSSLRVPDYDMLQPQFNRLERVTAPRERSQSIQYDNTIYHVVGEEKHHERSVQYDDFGE